MEEGTKKFINGFIIGSIITGLITFLATTAANVTSRAIEIKWLSPEPPKLCVYPCGYECGSKGEYLPTMREIHIFPDICIRNPTKNKVKINYYYVESSIDLPKFPKGEIKTFEIDPDGGEMKFEEVYRFETPKENTPFFMRFCVKSVNGEKICSEQLTFTPQGKKLE